MFQKRSIRYCFGISSKTFGHVQKMLQHPRCVKFYRQVHNDQRPKTFQAATDWENLHPGSGPNIPWAGLNGGQWSRSDLCPAGSPPTSSHAGWLRHRQQVQRLIPSPVSRWGNISWCLWHFDRVHNVKFRCCGEMPRNSRVCIYLKNTLKDMLISVYNSYRCTRSIVL